MWLLHKSRSPMGFGDSVVAVGLLCTLSLVSANKHHKTDSAPPSECQMLSQVQANVIRLLNTHHDHSKQLNLLKQVVEGLENDISVFKTSIDDMESRQRKLEATDKPAVSRLVDFDAKGMIHSMEKSISNLTRNFGTHYGLHQQLERKYKKLRKMTSRVTSTVGKLERSVSQFEDESHTLDHFLRTQKEINGNILQKIQFLESNIEQMKPQRDPPVITQEHDCPQGFVRHLTSCYKFENFTANWIEAEKHCQSLQRRAHLVSIESQEETDFMVRYRKHNEARWTSAYIWTGGNDMSKEGAWSWVGTGRALTYNDWKDQEWDDRRGLQHCIYFRAAGTDHRWDDWHCYAARLNFVCEINLAA